MIVKGTTPTVVLTVTDFELKDTDTIHMYFSQNNKMCFKKVTPDVVVEGNTVKTTLTQEDTFKLKKGKVKIQFRAKLEGGEKATVLASGEVYDQVQDIDDEDEVI